MTDKSPYQKVEDMIEEKAAKIEEKAKAAANEALADIKSGKPKKIAKWAMIVFVLLFFIFIIIGIVVYSIGDAEAACGTWMEDVIGQEFVADTADGPLHVTFHQPFVGPCPVGGVAVTWEGQSEPVYFEYTTTPEFLFIDGLRFILIGKNALVYVPEDQFIILQKVIAPVE